MALQWRAYYADGRTFSSNEEAWVNLPPKGLVGVVVFLEPPYRRIIDGYDWIWLENGEFHIVDTHDEWGKWAKAPEVSCASCVKQGVGMEDDAFKALQRRMFEDRIWP